MLIKYWPVLLLPLFGIAPVRSDDLDKNVASLVTQLRSPDETDRARAAWQLARLGVIAVKAQPAIRESLQDESPYVRIAAAEALVLTGEDISSVLPLLADPDSTVRFAIARFVIERQGIIRRAIPVLLEHPDGNDVFEAMGPSTAEVAMRFLFEYLKDDSNPRLQNAAVKALPILGLSPPKYVPYLIRLLESKNAAVQESVVIALGSLGSDAKLALPTLRAMAGQVDEKPHTLRLALAAAIGHIDPRDDAFLKVITDELYDKKSRRNAIYSLGSMGLRESAAIPTLIGLLNDDDEDLAEVVQSELLKIGERSIAPLTDTLEKNPDIRVRVRILEVLEWFGPKAQASESCVCHFGDDASPVVRRAAIATIGNLSTVSDATIARMVHWLSDEDPEIIVATLSSIRTLRPPAARVADAIKPLLNHLDNKVCFAATLCLNCIEDTPSEGSTAAVKQLKELVATIRKSESGDNGAPNYNHDGGVQTITLIDALAQAREKISAEAVAVCVESVELKGGVSYGFGGDSFSRHAIDALQKTARDDIPMLIPSLNHSDPHVRGAMCEALGEIGPRAGGAVAALLTHIGDRGIREIPIGCTSMSRLLNEEAITALGKIGPAAREVIPELVAILAAGKWETPPPNEIAGRPFPTAMTAIDALGAFGADAKSSVPVLHDVLRRADTEMAFKALRALSRIVPNDDATIDAANQFLEKLDSQPPWDDGYPSNVPFEEMGDVVERLGPRFRGGQEWLERQVNSPLMHPIYRTEAARVLAKIDRGNSSAIAYLRWECRRQSVSWSDDAKRALEELKIPETP